MIKQPVNADIHIKEGHPFCHELGAICGGGFVMCRK